MDEAKALQRKRPNRRRHAAAHAAETAPDPEPTLSHTALDREPVHRAKPHWSRCPKCGTDRKTGPNNKTPIIVRKRGYENSAIHVDLKCRVCDTRYPALRPD